MKTLEELFSLKDRTALITGGGGHLALAIAEALSEYGANIVLADINEDGLKKNKERITQQFGIKCETEICDIADDDKARALPGKTANIFGRLDILVNNAAFVGTSDIEGWATSFEKQTIDSWRKAMDVNINAVFNLCQCAAPLLSKNGKGSIINIASIYGVLGPDQHLYEGTQMGNPAAYAASKGGLIQFTRWLSTVLAPDIRVNAISPGGIERGQDKAFQKRYTQRTPLGRMGTEEDLKGIAAYLASDAAAYLTGQNIMVDGGWSAW